MKRAVSVSLGSSKRDKKVEIELLGQTAGALRSHFWTLNLTVCLAI